MKHLLPNPCKDCKKRDDRLWDSLEYGCDEPCQRAKDFFDGLETKLNELLKRAEELLKGNNTI